jgi:hypothetical protein
MYGWVQTNSEAIANIQQADLLKKVKFAAISSLEGGASDDQIVFDAGEEGQEYIDNDNNLGGDVVAAKGINQGRWDMFQEFSDIIQGFQFSSVMEPTTCDLCASLDEQTFKIDDPEAQDLTPPLHHQCQCILIPIMMDEEAPDEWTGLKASHDEIEQYQTLMERLMCEN